jgi:hypothetical protein
MSSSISNVKEKPCSKRTKRNKKTDTCETKKNSKGSISTLNKVTSRTHKITGKKTNVRLVLVEEAEAGPGEAEAGPGEAEAGPGEEEAGPGEAEAGPGEAEAGPGEAEAGPGEAEAGPGEAEAGPGEAEADSESSIGLEDTELKLNKLKNKMEIKERNSLIASPNKYQFLYPNLNDPDFNINIAQRKEFNDTQYNGEVKDVINDSEIMCNADFELAPHQLFVRNFLSFQTPYNSLLLYHGLGSGKTCSAISIAEEMRDYLIQMNIANRIIIVASPNVQENFKLQLFDERKLQLIDGIWNIRSCTGNKFLKEINPMNMKGLSRDVIVTQIKRIINRYYVFLGYTEFANYIQNKSTINDDIKDDKKRKSVMRNKIRQHFSNRLIIIDEVHNIRISDDNTEKKHVAQELFKLVKYADNMRLLFLSATPMYNSYKEIIWIVNIMNLNDRRSTIEIKDVFNADGTFKTSATGEPIGKDLLERKATGYISYVRGENPYTFPYKIWPDEFAPEHTFKTQPAPLVQLNGKPLLQNIEVLSVYLVNIGKYQQKGYDYIINKLKADKSKGNLFENMDAFGYNALQKPIEALNMIYPDSRLDASETEASETDASETDASETEASKVNVNTMDLVGSGGLERIMSYTKTTAPPARFDFEYKTDTYGSNTYGSNTNTYGRIFSPSEIGKYSGKIKSICEQILNSTGVVLIFSQYIDGGLLPIAIALEELGFTRAGNVRSLFKIPPTDKIDAITFKPKSDMIGKKTSKFSPAKYVMITGDKSLSPNNVKDINAITDINNKDGEQVKIVLISLAGSEGLDLKYIRQVHILDPWYNMSRIEQIIGRAVRTCSHKDLPFAKRNVEIFLYGTLLLEQRKEAADLYVYRMAELKAIQIGNVSRVIKEIAVDCILNVQQANFIAENMQQTVKLELSSGGTLDYAVGDKPYSAICDYMEKCNFTCKPNKEITPEDLNIDTYNEAFVSVNNDKIIYKIKILMKERFFYRKPLLVSMINSVKVYPQIQINSALNQLIEEKNEYITDKYGRLGNLINIGDLYLFQPLELNNEHIDLYERSVPVEFKHDIVNLDLSSKQLSKSKLTLPGEIEEEEPKQVQEKQVQEKQVQEKQVQEKQVQEKQVQEKQVQEKQVQEKQIQVKEQTKINKKTLLLIDEMHEKYKLASVPNKPKRGEDNWYKFSSEVINEMETLGLDREVLLNAVVEHICDELSFTDKMFLLNDFEYIEKDDFTTRIERYLFKNVMTNKGIQGIFLHNMDEQQLFVKRMKQLQEKDKWVLAEAEDINDLEKQIEALKTTFLPAKNKLHSVVGFMTFFKKEVDNIVFKLKVFKLNGVVKKRNKGARCYGKSIEMMTEIMGIGLVRSYIDLIQYKYKDIIEEKKKNRLLNTGSDEGIPDDLEAINHSHACVIQEMFLRVYNIMKKNDVIWFLSPEEAMLIDIENLSE